MTTLSDPPSGAAADTSHDPLATLAGERTEAVKSKAGRLEFLDALRGIAALTVAIQHIGEQQWVALLGWSHHWFRPGEFGVLVFFLCSGFIIPASLERRNDLKEFAIGRVFRLFPLYLVVMLAIGLAWLFSARLVPPTGYRGVEDTVVNLSMMQVFTTRPLVIGASWTLGYELVFYLLVAGLFLYGAHRKSTGLAVGLLTGALLFGTLVAPFLLQTRPHGWWTFPAALLIAAAAASVRLSSWPVRAVWLAVAAVIVLAISNRPHPLYFSLLLLAAMFVGTVLYRWTAGELSGRTAAVVFTLAIVINILTFKAWHFGYTEPLSGVTPRWWTEADTFVGAYLLFGACLLLRKRRWPKPLTYLGTISYSVYLLHAFVLIAFPVLHWSPWPTFLIMLATTIVGSMLTYHFVEKPAIALGRRVTSARRARLNRSTPDPSPVGTAAA